MTGRDGSTGDIAAGPGAVVAASRWAFPSSVDGGEDPPLRFVVFNPDPERSVRVTLLAVANGRETPVGGARDAEVPPGGRVRVGRPTRPGRRGWSRRARPVVVERVLVREGGVRLAAGVGIPSVEGAVPLGELVEG